MSTDTVPSDQARKDPTGHETGPTGDGVGSDVSFNVAARELDFLVGRLEGGDLDVDEVAAAVERASLLVEHCRHKVRGAQAQVRDITERAAAIS